MSFKITESLKTGVSFGLTSAIITTLGLMIGLFSATSSQLAVIGGVLTIALADAFSDALGIHMAKESENRFSNRQIWESTIYTFLSKFLFALTFVVPLLLFSLGMAVYVSIVWGVLLLVAISWWVAGLQKISRYMVIGEHLSVATVVVVLSYLLGNVINNFFT